MYHRDTNTYSLEPLANKSVLKGAPPPPEAYAEVKPIAKMTLKKGHVLSGDSAAAYKKVIKTDFKASGILHASVIHKRKNFISLVKCPMSKLCLYSVVTHKKALCHVTICVA